MILEKLVILPFPIVPVYNYSNSLSLLIKKRYLL